MAESQQCRSMKRANPKTNRNQTHTPKSPKGLGDFYGTGIVAKIGRVRDDTMGMHEIPAQKMKTHPKSIA